MTWRFVGAVMAVTLVVLLTLLIPVSARLAESERATLVTSLERDAFVLAGRSAAQLQAADSGTTAALDGIAGAYREATAARIVIVDSAGVAIVTSDDDAAAVGDSFLSRPEIESALAGQVASGTRYSDTLGFDLLYVAVPVLVGEQTLGAVRLTYPASTVDETVDAKVRSLGIVGVLTVLLAGVIGVILARTVTSRLRSLTAATEGLADGRLESRADDSDGAPELRSLARSFNRMADRLTRLLDQQRAFASDAAHQLRTPLTALRLRLERARSLAADTEVEERIAAAQAEVDRLDTLVEGLLRMSRGEGASLPRVRVDLRQVAAERVEHWQALAAERSASVQLEAVGESIVLADVSAVEQILDNLVDNALEVSPEGGRIILRVDARGRVAVLDDGPGLPEPDLERAFERFWRARRDTAGSGLGLAIVAQLAHAVGGTVSLRNRVGGGLEAVAVFELAPVER